ncbi:MAG: WxcM-like domain-containing protein [Bacteroidota bacterium]
MELKNIPEIITGGIHSDERGELLYNNDFDLTTIKRMYIIKHPDKNVVRAWQGHQQEHKFFKCIRGSFVVAWKKIDDFNNPTDNHKADYTVLTESENNLLSVPPGYANGIKALEANAELMVFSDFKLGESLDDKIRFDKNLWLDWDQF